MYMYVYSMKYIINSLKDVENMYMPNKYNVTYTHIYIYKYIYIYYSMKYIKSFLKNVEKTKHVHDYDVHDPTPSHPTPPWLVAST